MTKIHKEIVLAIFIVLFGIITWFFLNRVLYFEGGITFLILTVLGFLFFGISVGLGSLLINKKIILYLAFILSLFSFFVFFRGAGAVSGQFREAFYYFIVLVLTFITLIVYRKRVRYEEHARIKLNFWRIFKKGLPLVFTFICLLISLTYYFSPALGKTSKMEFNVPRDIFNVVLKPLSGLIQTRLPLYKPDMSVDELITMFSITDEGKEEELYEIIQSKGISIETLDLDKLLENPGVAEAIREKIKDQINALSDEQRIQQREDFGKKLGINIKGNETLEDVLYKLVNSQINSLGGPYKKYIPIVIAIGLFFTLRIISILLIAFIVLISCLIVRILTSTGFAKILIKQIEMEDIELN